ncbi:hypothetical protein GJAV_G00179560 [Gymnothorax javanicus]|nr:hypothetical protein GJAV_G00179560 [Gymnothorax javanicus]
MILGSINRAGPVPTFLRTPPTVIQPPLDMKPFLQFPLESPPPPPTVGLFHNFSTLLVLAVFPSQPALSSPTLQMDPVQKAVINHTFGIPLIKQKRPVISCNVCQIRFNSESQAEAHYKGNRHARRVKGIETSKTRPQDGDKLPPPRSTASPSPTGPQPPATSDPEPGKQDEAPPLPQMNGIPLAAGAFSNPTPPASDLPLLPASPLPPPSSSLLPAPSSSSSDSSSSSSSPSPHPDAAAPGPLATPSPAPCSAESEEDRAKKLLYCSLCKVAVNSLSQLEAHNKGTKHKTILEARSGLGPIKAYPRLGPKPSTEQGGAPGDPNTQERTFHCEICNVRVNSELQLKQHISSRRHRDGVAGKPNPLLSRHKKRTLDLTDLPKALGAGLLPSPLAVAAAMAAAASSSPLALRSPGPAHPHAHLLQSCPPPLSHALLRPAPGPIRTSHGPILFSPY